MTEARPQLRGLYAITPYPTDDAVGLGRAALRAGAHLIQYRDKSADETRRLTEAAALAAACRAHDALLLVNDDVELAQACGAHGVHLGQADMPLAEARARLGGQAVIGVTCHASLALAQTAEAGGADYVAFGRFFPSRSKPAAPPAPLSLLREAQRLLSVPIVAIGGITPENGAQLVAAGADMLAAIEGIFAQDDIGKAVARWQTLFASSSERHCLNNEDSP